MRCATLLIGLMVFPACDPSAEAPAELAIEVAGPPLVLSAPDLYSGQPATLSTTGANPGDRVWFLGSVAGFGSGACPPAMGGICLDIANARVLGSAVANGQGDASITLTVPSSITTNSLVWLQAAVAIGPRSYKSSYTLREVLDPACPQILMDFLDETTWVRSCVADAECGQVLSGTSCGCTRNWVARIGVDTTDFYRLLNDASACGAGLVSTCDCPPANGFACVNNTCTWNYP